MIYPLIDLTSIIIVGIICITILGIAERWKQAKIAEHGCHEYDDDYEDDNENDEEEEDPKVTPAVTTESEVKQ